VAGRIESRQPIVLAGFGDALAAPETVWSLLDGGCGVVAFSRRGTPTSLRYARGVEIVEITAPEGDASATIAEVRSLIEQRAFAFVMPLDDAAIWVCAHATEDATVLIVGPSTPDAVELALDKRVQLRAAAAAGLRVPPTVVDALPEDEPSEITFPVIVKPALVACEVGGRLLRRSSQVCNDASGLARVFDAWNEQPLLVQPLIVGTGEGLFGLAAEGVVQNWSAHRRVRMMNPRGSGSSACRPWEVDEGLAVAGEKLLASVGWRGMFMLEFLRDDQGRAWFMELNGRPWGSMALARRQGLEYPFWALRQARGERLAGTPAPARVNFVCRHLGREIVHLLIVLIKRRPPAVPHWPSRWSTIRDVLRVKRSDRWYNVRRGEKKVFLADAWYTVRDQLFRRRY
jgi:predicted ATP-grasp superfamily ATP-dependent carboligase